MSGLRNTSQSKVEHSIPLSVSYLARTIEWRFVKLLCRFRFSGLRTVPKMGPRYIKNGCRRLWSSSFRLKRLITPTMFALRTPGCRMCSKRRFTLPIHGCLREPLFLFDAVPHYRRSVEDYNVANSEYTRFSNVLARFEADKIVSTTKSRDSIQVPCTTYCVGRHTRKPVGTSGSPL